MYEFSSWCFLCAREQNVEAEIKSLKSEFQEKISEFSIVNYNIPGCPSKICKTCLKFLDDIFYFSKRYETVEKFYIELLKNKNKNVNLNEMKVKYEILDDRPEVVERAVANKRKSIQSPKQTPLVQIPSPSLKTLQSSDFEVPEINLPQSSDKTFKTPPEKSPRKQILTPQISILNSPKKSVPKILNPTILPKIESKIRLEILTCDLCSHTTSTKTSLEKHMDIHLRNEKLFECQVCQKKFSKKPILMSHELTHKLSSERKTFQCKECGKHLSSQTAVNTHMKWHHEEREFKCHICSKEFATKGSLKEHLKIHSNQKQHICPICNKEYKTASTLSNHLDTHSTTTYECYQCGLKLNSKRTLRQHEKVHSNVSEHVCSICGAEFKRTKAYKEHLIIHSNIRPYECEFCGKTFTNGPNCRKHKREIHPKQLKEAERKGVKPKVVKLPNISDLLAMTSEMAKN